MKRTQVKENPYKNSDSNKRYYTYDYYLRRTFGGKCAKISIDGGFTCPNMDGRCGYGGCIYCGGDFAPTRADSIEDQFASQTESAGKKWRTDRYIAYFQAHTNTYAPVCILRDKFERALSQNGVVGLNIATRADCLPDDTVEYLADLADRTVLTVELGLQTANDDTARLINRGHSLEEFVEGYNRLRAASPRINICIHLILGLPGEGREEMLSTVRQVAALAPHQVKLHMLYVTRGTKLAQMYEKGEYLPIEREEYIRTVCEALTLLPPDTVIARITGDGAGDSLIAPDWSRKKVAVINDIDKHLFENSLWQGKNFGGNL